jgi:hypothetical protein
MVQDWGSVRYACFNGLFSFVAFIFFFGGLGLCDGKCGGAT